VALLSWKLSEILDLHTILGFTKNHVSGSTEPLLNLALSWSPTPALSLVAERMAVRGNLNQYNAGARW
jgi:hypothetical protein